MRLVILGIAVCALTGCQQRKAKIPPVTQNKTEPVLRVHRIEITDDAGRVRAIVGFSNGSQEPEVTLLTADQHPAASLRLDQRGQATMSFSDPNGVKGHIDGRVQVGYLWGSDCCYKPGEYDPLGSWGTRVLTKDKNGYLGPKELFLADPNEKDLSRFVSPVQVPTSKVPDAYRR